MKKIIQIIFFGLIVRPIMLVAVGMNIRHKERLPQTGPAIIAANHNSHLDTLALMATLPLFKVPMLRPIAAADYFLGKKFLSWFALNIIGIIPIERDARKKGVQDPLSPCHEALKRGEILIIYPEGTRGEAEKLSAFKKGIAHLAMKHQDIPVHPVFMHGMGKVLPRGDWLPVPFFCDIFIGEKLPQCHSVDQFMQEFTSRIEDLAKEGHFPAWE